MATETPEGPKPGAALKSWQVYLFAGSVGLLALYASVTLLVKPEYIGLLWRDPLGVQMSLAAAVLLALGSAFFLGGAAVLNRALPGARRGVAINFYVSLALVWVALFFGPALFIVTVGPAAIQIQKNLLKD